MPTKPSDDHEYALNVGWCQALCAVTSAAQQAWAADVVRAAPVVALARTQRGDTEAYAFRLAATKLLWASWKLLTSLDVDNPHRVAASLGEAALAQGRAVADVTSAVNEADGPAAFVKAMTYPEGDPPPVEDIAVAAAVALHHILIVTHGSRHAATPGDADDATAQRWELIGGVMAVAGI